MEVKREKPIVCNWKRDSKSTKDLCGYTYDEQTKKTILKYLRSYEPVAFSTARVFDYITEKETDVQAVLYTDGEYKWYESEVYHFEHYDLRLNDDFIEYVLKK